jgi:hypothetical protein
LLRCPGKLERRVQAALYSAHNTCQAGLPGKLTERRRGGHAEMAVPWRVKLLGKLRAKNPGRSSEVVKYPRYSLDFAKTNMNPDEPRSPRGGRARGTLTSRAWVLPRRWSGPPVKDFAETPRRGAFGRENVALGTARKGCLFSRTAATVTHSPRGLAGFA